MSANPYEQGPFRQVCDMETPLATMHDMLRGLAMLAETMDEDHANVVQRMAWVALDQCNIAERLRGDLFDLTHPNPASIAEKGR